MLKSSHPVSHPNPGMRPVIQLPTAAHIHTNARAAGILAGKVHKAVMTLPDSLRKRIG